MDLEINKSTITLWNGTQSVEYYVNVFERNLTILFKDEYLTGEDLQDIYNTLDKAYSLWNEDDHGFCCEEFMIYNLDTYYKNCIVAVIYEDIEEEI